MAIVGHIGLVGSLLILIIQRLRLGRCRSYPTELSLVPAALSSHDIERLFVTDPQRDSGTCTNRSTRTTTNSFCEKRTPNITLNHPRLIKSLEVEGLAVR